ncbi:Type 1 glutamine amidotransferase-like domain-containing protein [Halobacillus sp. H74]|uniref:Type 1 glutamine amidotransferase-like domain-containing protein n=1 Tax=Halobacillus sp. H74 TaxID=3457436 RepID=UPI003FCDD3AD
MESSTHLFLFGSSPPFTPQLASKFENALEQPAVTVLYIEREGSVDYLPKYTSGMKVEADHFPLKPHYSEQELNRLRESGGVIIGGGDTLAYHDYIIETDLANILQDKFQQGQPIAGFSAGALILPEYCVISPEDHPERIQVVRTGIGLLKGVVISAHFLEWNEHKNLEAALKRTGIHKGYGIAEGGGIYLKDQHLVGVEGFLHIEHQK